MRDLWRSQRTGRVRTGTRIAELRRLFESQITVKAIYEPLECCFVDDLATEAAARMARLDFDEMGMRVEVEGPIIGYCRASQLDQGACADHLLHFAATDLVADSTPLIAILPTLRHESRRYVLSGQLVDGIVTRADLQKPAVRMWIFGLVTLLETHLSFLVRRFYGNDWQGTLSGGRLEKAKELMAARSERDEALSLIDCLQFCDKRDLIAKHQDGRMALGFDSRTQADAGLKMIEELRDRIAHAQDLVAGSNWATVIDTIVLTEDLIERSEQIVDRAPTTPAP